MSAQTVASEGDCVAGIVERYHVPLAADALILPVAVAFLDLG
jgi:hypothetical protein